LGFGEGQSAEQTAGQGQAEGRQTDRQRSAVLLLFQLFAEMSIVFISVYPSYISGMRTFSLRRVKIKIV
jgi:hypothetical protein